MVNKAIVGILVLIVLTSLGVGVLIGTQLGGDGGASEVQSGETSDGSASGDDAEGTATATTTNGTATATGTNSTATATSSTATPTATPTPTPTTTPYREFDTAAIERDIVAAVNSERSDRGLDTYETDTTTAGRVQQMARYHSQAMADEQSLSYTAGGNTTAERYEEAELFARCRYQDPETGDIIDPDNDFQSLGKTFAGKEYDDGGATRFNENESQVAQAIVDDWFASSTYRTALVDRGPTIIGVGVTITDGGEVYASAAICE
jgi:uncharacterized protein YkwD